MNKYSVILVGALIAVGCDKKSNEPAFVEVGAPAKVAQTPSAPVMPSKMERVPSGFPIYTGLVNKPVAVESMMTFEGVRTEDDFANVIAEYKKMAKDWRCEEIGKETWFFKPGTKGETMRIMLIKTPKGKAQIIMGTLDLNQLQMVVANIFPFLKERGRDHIKGITTKRMWKDVESGKIEAMLADYKFAAGARKDGSSISTIPMDGKDRKPYLCQCHMVVEDGLPRIDSITIVPGR